jgi:hypothetical protein
MKEIKRGYVKWTDEDGTYHKELLTDHPELLAKATDRQKIAAEEARRLNDDAEKQMNIDAASVVEDASKTLVALKAAPVDVLTTGDLVAITDDKGQEKIVPATDHISSVSLDTPVEVKQQTQPSKTDTTGA